ncbi:hypothetical protein Q8A73_008590 [Channa argus]|nr:hypothetical protein Q8A73_008590 [Channa argus]
MDILHTLPRGVFSKPVSALQSHCNFTQLTFSSAGHRLLTTYMYSVYNGKESMDTSFGPAFITTAGASLVYRGQQQQQKQQQQQTSGIRYSPLKPIFSSNAHTSHSTSHADL